MNSPACKTGFRAPTPWRPTVALSDAINGYIDDLHSSFRYASPYAGDVEVVPTVASVSTQRLIGHAQRLAQAMMDAMPTGMKFYQEVGNTAYVSFNTFEINDDVDYYQALAEGEQIADTIGVIHVCPRADHPRKQPH